MSVVREKQGKEGSGQVHLYSRPITITLRTSVRRPESRVWIGTGAQQGARVGKDVFEVWDFALNGALLGEDEAKVQGMERKCLARRGVVHVQVGTGPVTS